MFDRILQQMRERIRKREYVMTFHAEEEMNDDELSIFDVEHGILTGIITERQKDKITADWKYCIRGSTAGGWDVEIVVRTSVTGKLVIITVYAL